MRQVDHQRAIGHGLARNAVAAPAHGDRNLIFARDANHLHHVGNAGRLNNGGGPAIDHAVPYAARQIVLPIVGGENRAVQQAAQPGELLR